MVSPKDKGIIIKSNDFCGDIMTNIKQYVIGYIEGRVPSKEFLNTLWQDDSIFEWLQSIVPEGMIGYYESICLPDGTPGEQKTGPYDAKHKITVYWNDFGGSLGKELNIHYEISQLVKKAFPNENIKEDKTLDKKFDFLLDACPEYIGGPEVDESEILERIMNELPEGISKTQRIKIFKERVKAEFHIEGQKYPRWLQPAEWPFSNGKPMRFLCQKSEFKGELRQYCFEDVDTKEQRVIEQFT